MTSWLKIRISRLLNSYEILGKQGIEISPYQAQRFGDFFVMLPQLNGTDGFFGAVLEKVKPESKRKASKDEEVKASELPGTGAKGRSPDGNRSTGRSSPSR